MNYKIIAIPNFRKNMKKLAKKFPSIKADFAQLLEDLQEDQGIPLGNNCYKIQMRFLQKEKGNLLEQGSSLICKYLNQ